MSDSESYILEFNQVSCGDLYNNRLVMRNADFRLSRGDLLLLLLEEENLHIPLCELAQGLVMPDSGQVCFVGKEWGSMSPDEQSDKRGCIGRVFANIGWVSNLTVYDNITLGQLYHSDYCETDIRAQADALAAEAGLSFIPDGREDAVRPSLLKKCQWVRAFLGKPVLLLLEFPEAGVKDADLQNLIDLVSRARARGAAVIWTTADEKIFRAKQIKPSWPYRMNDRAMVPTSKESDE